MSNLPADDKADPTPGPGKDSGDEPVAGDSPASREVGGRKGPDPTRYGDWEKNGRCIDF